MIGRQEILLVWVAFFLIMALTTNVGFLTSGDIWELIIAALFNIAALMVKWRLKTGFMGRVSLAVSIAAALHIIPAAIFGITLGLDGVIDVANITASTDLIARAVYGLAYGALAANIVSVVLMVTEASSKS